MDGICKKELGFAANLSELLLLTQFSPVSHFYTSWKHQKTKGFLTFSGGVEMDYWAKMD